MELGVRMVYLSGSNGILQIDLCTTRANVRELDRTSYETAVLET